MRSILASSTIELQLSEVNIDAQRLRYNYSLCLAYLLYASLSEMKLTYYTCLLKAIIELLFTKKIYAVVLQCDDAWISKCHFSFLAYLVFVAFAVSLISFHMTMEKKYWIRCYVNFAVKLKVRIESVMETKQFEYYALTRTG